MEIKKCKNKKCMRTLPESYKHKYCENCRNDHVKMVKDAGKAVAGIGVLMIGVITKGKINIKK